MLTSELNQFLETEKVQKSAHYDVSADVYTGVMLLLFAFIIMLMLYRSMNWSSDASVSELFLFVGNFIYYNNI